MNGNGLGRCDTVATNNLQLDGFVVRDVAQAGGQQAVAFAIDSWASAEVTLLVLLDHLG